MPEKHNAERRERYTKAVEQLGSKEAPVRIGGVYTLVGLVDEWLLDENLDYTEKVREGQVIINSLCAYIRSSFALAFHYDELTQDAPTAEGLYKNREQEFYIDKAGLESEKKVRLSIIKEIRHRLQGSKENTPGVWSDFEYDFSGSLFFYPVDFTHSYYAKPVNFSGSAYWGEADFSYSTYMDEVYFSESSYQGRASFNGSIYQGEADFRGSTYRGSAGFARSTYRGGAYFNGSTYLSEAVFRGSVYQCAVAFNSSAYHYWVDLRGSTYQGAADFGGSAYQYWADFRGSTYRRWAYFNDSICCGWAGLSHSVYEGEADFSGSVFCGALNFGTDFFGKPFPSRFVQNAPCFVAENDALATLFGSSSNNFVVEDSGYPVSLGANGLPLGCGFLSTEQAEYLAAKFREVYEARTYLRGSQVPQEQRELLGRLEGLNEELRTYQKDLIALTFTICTHEK